MANDESLNQSANPGPTNSNSNTQVTPISPNVPPPAVTFSKEQIDMIEAMFKSRIDSIKDSLGGSKDSPNSAISMYNLRDPKEIKTVKVNRFDGKWVIGFKDLQTDPYKKHIPKYLRYGIEPIRKLNNEPYVTLLLSNDGKEVVEKEVLLVDYVEYRDQVNVPVIKIEIKEKINDHGILGSSDGFAIAVDEKGKPENRPTILAQSKTVDRIFTVQLEGFDKPSVFITDFLG